MVWTIMVQKRFLQMDHNGAFLASAEVGKQSHKTRLDVFERYIQGYMTLFDWLGSERATGNGCPVSAPVFGRCPVVLPGFGVVARSVLAGVPELTGQRCPVTGQRVGALPGTW